jgi:hypothetical protein
MICDTTKKTIDIYRDSQLSELPDYRGTVGFTVTCK